MRRGERRGTDDRAGGAAADRRGGRAAADRWGGRAVADRREVERRRGGCTGRRPEGGGVAAEGGWWSSEVEAQGGRRRRRCVVSSRRGPRDADGEAAPDLSRWGGKAPGKIGGSGFLTLERGLPNGDAVWPGSQFHVGVCPGEKARIPAGFWAPKLGHRQS